MYSTDAEWGTLYRSLSEEAATLMRRRSLIRRSVGAIGAFVLVVAGGSVLILHEAPSEPLADSRPSDANVLGGSRPSEVTEKSIECLHFCMGEQVDRAAADSALRAWGAPTLPEEGELSWDTVTWIEKVPTGEPLVTGDIGMEFENRVSLWLQPGWPASNERWQKQVGEQIRNDDRVYPVFLRGTFGVAFDFEFHETDSMFTSTHSRLEWIEGRYVQISLAGEGGQTVEQLKDLADSLVYTAPYFSIPDE